jgi:CRISPR-associated protein Cmr3
MPQYLITLTPLDTFFFGGETTFGQNDGANYFAKSNLFPQQTTLLGALRRELLRQNPNFDQIKLIGLASFKGIADASFGRIHQISPVFMRYQDENYFVRSREFVTDKEETTHPLNLSFHKGTHELNTLSNGNIPLLKKQNGNTYNPKEDFAEALVAGEMVFPMEKVFISNQKIGITKYKNGAPKLENGKATDNSLGFYKQSFYRLAKDWSFAFFLTLNTDELDFNFKESVLTMGGENRPFAMKITPMDETGNIQDEYQDENMPCFAHGKKIVLLSDAFVTPDIYKYCLFAITTTTTFRNIQTDIATQHWADLGENAKQPQKSAIKWQVLKRGSVFFTNQHLALEAALNNPIYQKIGYNIYKTI